MVKLDKQQQAIVNSNAAKICVIAGAGSGKTYTVIERIRKLLSDGEDPSDFVCITFTKMAAQEMKNRLADIPGSNRMFIGTIHAFAYRILSKSGIQANLLTADKEREITRTLIEKYAKHLTLDKYDEWAERQRLMDLGYYKSYEADNLLNSMEAEDLANLFDHIDLKSIYNSMSKEDVEILTKKIMERENRVITSKDYPETMRSTASRMGLITFNALLEECNKVNASHKIKYLFVDEFQDIGAFEYKFLIGLNAENVFVVGDDYQCHPSNVRIKMSDGSVKRIHELQLHDEVYCWDFKNNIPTTSIVTSVTSAPSENLVRIGTKTGKVCLYTYHHKCYVWDNGEIKSKFAGNLCLNDIMVGVSSDTTYLTEDVITSIENITPMSDNNSEMYSIEVAKYHNYIADGLLTHNSIYSFKGSDFEYFKKLASDEEFTTYKMENNYRCESHIVEFGNKVISQINDVIPKKCVSKVKSITKGSLIYKEGNIHTVEQYLKFIDARDYGKWFVLTRSNNDMVDISRLCYKLGIPTVTFKKGNMTSDEVESTLAQNAVKILTVHSAKGLESDNVLLYGNFPINKDNQFWEEVGTEECRIFYVGATRAKHNLVVICKQDKKFL